MTTPNLSPIARLKAYRRWDGKDPAELDRLTEEIASDPDVQAGAARVWEFVRNAPVPTPAQAARIRSLLNPSEPAIPKYTPPQPESPTRMVVDARQVVEVGRYAYAWAGPEPLKVGDRVLLPENWLTRMDSPGPFEGTVTQLGTAYTGELSQIIQKLGD